MNDYGFEGVRIDCVDKIPFEVRKTLYDHIKTINKKAIILEEALFEDKSPEEFSKIIKDAGGTHITGSSYYRDREWHGGFKRQHEFNSPGDSNNEEYWKRSIISSGVINFNGNHDHHSCMMQALINLTNERLDNDDLFKRTFIEFTKIYSNSKTSKNLTEFQMQGIQQLFSYYYIEEILFEIANLNSETIQRVGKLVRVI